MKANPRPKIVFMVGFDRCGSSMIAALLTKHPRVNLLFQPFNSTEIHKTQWEIWLPEKNAPKTEVFLNGLLKGYVDKSYISSDWFYKHSTSFEIEPEKVNLIKDTKLHFKTKWLRYKYPEIAFCGIWRDPRGIVCSLMRNDFYRKWYGEKAFEAIKGVIEHEPIMGAYHRYLHEPLNDMEKMALMVAVRTHYMVQHLNPDDWLIYEDVLSDANGSLNTFVKRFNLKEFDFFKHISEDFNVIGMPFEKADLWQKYFSREQIKRLDEMFTILSSGTSLFTGIEKQK